MFCESNQAKLHNSLYFLGESFCFKAKLTSRFLWMICLNYCRFSHLIGWSYFIFLCQHCRAAITSHSASPRRVTLLSFTFFLAHLYSSIVSICHFSLPQSSLSFTELQLSVLTKHTLTQSGCVFLCVCLLVCACVM